MYHAMAAPDFHPPSPWEETLPNVPNKEQLDMSG